MPFHRLDAFSLPPLLLCLCCVAVSTPVVAEDANANAPSVESVTQLIELTNGPALAEQMFSQLIAVIRQQHNLPQQVVDELREETDFTGLLTRTIPVYQKHLTQADVDAAVTFWSSEAGQRFSQAAPKISEESFTIGQQWGRELANRAIMKVRTGKLKQQ